MFRTIAKTWPQGDLPARAYRMAILRRVLEGSFYDNLPHAFAEESNVAGEYVPLRKRRPSVRASICRIVVDDSVSLLFGDDNAPSIVLENKEQEANLRRVLAEANCNEAMLEAGTRGAVGSIAVMFQVLRGRVFLRVLDTDSLTPTWDSEAPDTLISVTERYQVKGAVLADLGYTIAPADLAATFWFQRTWDTQSETWYQPQKITAKSQPKLDAKRSVQHKLGFVPIAWIKNLPGGDGIDGMPTITGEAIDCQIEVDYQLSQAGRALKFMGDPTLVIKENSPEDGPRVKGAANALSVPETGDAKLLEISGEASTAVIEYVKHLREVALESLHGNRATNEKIAAAQSGKAMELMNQPLIWLAGKLRISYGGALIELAIMVIKASKMIGLVFRDGTPAGAFDQKEPTLNWPRWFAPTLHELQSRASTLVQLTSAGLMSRETAIGILCAEYGIEDADAEKVLADAELAARNATAKIQVAIAE
jgi:hypothetical protein